MSWDVTFHEDQNYIIHPYLQGESLWEDKENNFDARVFPTLELNSCDLTQKPEQETLAQNESNKDAPTKLENDTRFGKNLIYIRRSKAISESIHAQEANLTPVDQVTNSGFPILNDNLLASPNETKISEHNDDLYLPIAFRK